MSDMQSFGGDEDDRDSAGLILSMLRFYIKLNLVQVQQMAAQTTSKTGKWMI
jgi:hypothetical protein